MGGFLFCFVFPPNTFKETGRKVNFSFFSITYKSVSIIRSQAYFFPSTGCFTSPLFGHPQLKEGS